MTKLTRKLFAILLTLTMILSPAGTAAIATGLPPIAGDEIITDNYNELGIRSAVSAYFNQREAYLLGEATTIDNINPGLLDDESKHRDAIFESDVERVGSSIVINNVAYWDSHAEANVTETVRYLEDCAEKTEVIVHKLQLGQVDDGRIFVVRDMYFEQVSEFRSCSYIDESETSGTLTIVPEGGAACIITKAQSQLGQNNSDKKYGDTGSGGWCIAFIKWCAAQVDIPAAVIWPTYAPPELRNFYINANRYHSRESGYIPQPGDIYFTIVDNIISHGGIVTSVEANKFHTINGNWGGVVGTAEFSYTDEYIVGYGNPDYFYYSSGHNYSEYTYINETYHRVSCAHCDSPKSESHTLILDSWFYNGTYHWRQCACGKHGTETAHIFMQDSVTGMKKCRMCGVYENMTMGIPPATVVDK